MRSVTKMKSVISPCLSNPAAPFALCLQSLQKNPIFSRSKVLASIASIKNPVNVRNFGAISSSLKPMQEPSQARSLSSDAACSPSSSGEIHVIVGPMFAGKTTTLLRRMKSESSNGSFQGGDTKDMVCLDDTLRGLCISGNVAEAVKILCFGGVRVKSETYSLLLQDCIFRKYHRLAKRIHWQMVVVGFVPDEYLNVKLLILYAKAGDLSIAHFLFQKFKVKSLVSWNSMIAGYIQKGMEDVGLSMYSEMRGGGLIPDQYTFASVFRACASLAILEQGRQAHATWMKIQKNGNLVVNSAIMDMYFKCSSLSDGHLVFEKSLERNVVTWTSLISGYGHHGRVADVLSSFHRMSSEGFRPNHVTFLAVLVACSHGGMLDEAWECFDSMMRDYGLQPQGKHYAAMVDVLGRAGKLDDAYNFILSSPCKEHPVLWGALVGACRIHGNMDLAKVAAKNFFDLEPGNSGKYVVLGNAYASFGLWDNVAKIRSSMSEAGMKKDRSYSMIEVQREAHFFYMEHNVHDKTEETYEMVERIIRALKDVEHVPDVEC